MGVLAFNALGGTVADPCPTTVSKVGRWFGGGSWCSREEYASWRQAAANLYELGIQPLWNVLRTLPDASGPAATELEVDVDGYASVFNSMPVNGSFWSTARNIELVAESTALMLGGEALIDALTSAILDLGGTPPTLIFPGAPSEPRRKSALRRYLMPGVFVGGAVLVIGLTVAALSTRRRRADDT